MIRTIKGHMIDFLSPSEESIDIEDIAWALAREGRWGNHSLLPYSVAEHSIQMSYLSEYPREALLHDATEAYMRDIPSPLKVLIPRYSEIEDRLQGIIFRKFGLEGIPEEVHYWDKELRIHEWDNVVVGNSWVVLTPKQARKAFLNRFNELWNTKY